MSGSPASAQADSSAAHRAGLIAGLGAYGLWGLLPLYFKLLSGVSSVEIVAHRVVWSVLFLAILLAFSRAYPAMLAVFRQPRILAALIASALLICGNWLVFVWAVANDHVVAGSMGYFLTPLVSTALGKMVLKETVRRGQLVALIIAGAAVAILAVGDVHTFWIGLALAVTFALYGLIRKMTPVGASVGLGVETALLGLPALAFLIWSSAQGELAFGQTPMLTLWLIGTGAVTSIPLILFATAARALPLVTLSQLQYIPPMLQFLTGVLLFGEQLSTQRWASFLLIWVALALFVRDGLIHARRTRNEAAA